MTNIDFHNRKYREREWSIGNSKICLAQRIINPPNSKKKKKKTGLKRMLHVEHATQIVKSSFKNAMLTSNLCDYSDPYIPLKTTIAITGASIDARRKKQTNNIQKLYTIN